MRIFTLILLSIVLVSCSSAKKEKESIQEKVASSTVNTSQSFGQTIQDHIENSKTLSDSQRVELRKILGDNKALADKLMAESFKTRGVLIQELLTGKSTPKRVTILETEIERIEKLRLKNTFDTVKKISKIVSGQPDSNQFAEEMIQLESRSSTKR
jgi:hypothetical protein